MYKINTFYIYVNTKINPILVYNIKMTYIFHLFNCWETYQQTIQAILVFISYDNDIVYNRYPGNYRYPGYFSCLLYNNRENNLKYYKHPTKQ